MKSKSILFLISSIFIILYTCDCFAQSSRFKTGVVAGLNFSELEGDEITDYLGLNAGLIGTARLSKQTQIGMEILFSQNGEYILPKSYPGLQYGQIWLNHIEVPIHFDWLIGVFQRDKFYDWNLNIGVAYTRLLSYQIETSDKIKINDQIVYENKDALLLQFGTNYNFTKHIGLNLKATLPIRIEDLSWTLAARIVYMI